MVRRGRRPAKYLLDKPTPSRRARNYYNSCVSFRKPSRFHLLLAGVPLLFFMTLKSHGTHCGEGDEPHYLLVGESLIDDFDLNMVNQYPDRHRFIPQLELGGHSIPDRFGGQYPVHALGLSVLLVPALLAVHAFVPYVPQAVLNALRLTPEKLTVSVLAQHSMLVTCLLTVLLFVYLGQA